jgi:hypothetical protein
MHMASTLLLWETLPPARGTGALPGMRSRGASAKTLMVFLSTFLSLPYLRVNATFVSSPRLR